MLRLHELQRNVLVRGIRGDGPVTIVDVQRYGEHAAEVVFKDRGGQVHTQLLFQEHEAELELVTDGQPWRFDADGGLLRLVSEAKRVRLAHLFDPYLAVHTSQVEPLPHQITAVYEIMLRRQPLRFLLADDPGAGKTIMAGLLIKELQMRGDLRRCLIVCPGSLVEQWQDEMDKRFALPFEILTRERMESARTGNAFAEIPLLITRLDRLARNDDAIEKLAQTDWDLIVCDEAHKMAASFFGGEIKYTKRYRLGQRLSQVSRHFLLMTATPHNGKEEDFQLFMALLDGDRFEGRFRDGVHAADVSDLMRRMVKEKLVRFDGTPLFPERRAYTVPYRLSDGEAALYHAVTDYVREEFDRAERLLADGRAGTIGFALTILQRRLASSPEAIYRSLKRRRERMESRLAEAQILQRGAEMAPSLWEELVEDPDELLPEEQEEAEEALVDQASAARTVAELRVEIRLLERLERMAEQVRQSGTDRKWEELSGLLQNQSEMFDSSGSRRKLVIFTEHRDTLAYLVDKIRALLGRAEAVIAIHGGVRREERAQAQAAFTNDPTVQVLIATDAAGEGINLQRAHLMINYDLPWNPNRLEQRFGRIHRIGQSEVCHLWNLVAEETREGDVYLTLLRKLERERESLGGAVFDVLGAAIDGKQLRELLIEAIRYGERADVQARRNQVLDGALDTEHLRQLINEHALARDVMDTGQVHAIRQEMERAEARRLQPHYIAAFFRAAFEKLGGSLRERETDRYEITHVPAAIRERERLLGSRGAVQRRYERVCFEKKLLQQPGRAPAELLCPGHPLLDATVELILERYGDLLRQGAVLVDENDPGEEMRALVYLEHAIHDGRPPSPDSGGGVGGGGRGGGGRLISKRLQFVEFPLDATGQPQSGRAANAGYAPYLDYRPLTAEEQETAQPLVERMTAAASLEQWAVGYAIGVLAPAHLAEVRGQREPLIDKTRAAVHARLTKEIIYWDQRYAELRAQEQAGRVNARLNSEKARQRAEELELRLSSRMAELEQERRLAPLPPVVVGGALVIPIGLLVRLRGERPQAAALFARETARVEQAALAAVMASERALGYSPRDVSAQKVGYDIESVDPATPDSPLRLLEVKGRIAGSTTVTVTRNEILHALNKPEQWLLALVSVPRSEELPLDVFAAREAGVAYGPPPGCVVRYVQMPFSAPPDFGAVSVNYDWADLWRRGFAPA